MHSTEEGPWTSLGNSIAAGSAPTVITSDGRFPQEDIYVVGGGAGGPLYAASLNVGTGQLSAWTSLGNIGANATPSVVSRMPYDGSPYEDIYVRGAGGSVYWKWFNVNTGQQGPWVYLNGGTNAGAQPTVTTFMGRFPGEDIYQVNSDGTLSCECNSW